MPKERRPHSDRDKPNKTTAASGGTISTFTKLLQERSSGRLIDYRKNPWLKRYSEQGIIPQPKTLDEILRFLGIDRDSEDGHKLKSAAHEARRALKANKPTARRREQGRIIKAPPIINETEETPEDIEAALKRADEELAQTDTVTRQEIDPVSVVSTAQAILGEARNANKTMTQGELAMAVVKKLKKLGISRRQVIEILTSLGEDDPIGFSNLPPTITLRTVDDWYDEEKQRNN